MSLFNLFKNKQAKNEKINSKEKTFYKQNDNFSLRKYKNSMQYYLPYDIAIDNRTVLSKYGGYMRFLKITNLDTRYLPNEMIHYYLDKINDMFKRLGGGCVVNYETIREPIEINDFNARPYAPLSTQIGNFVRYNNFKNSIIYQNTYYITFSYIDRKDAHSKIQDLLLGNKNVVKKLDDKELEKVIKEKYEEFETAFELFVSGLKEYCLEVEVLEGNDITNYLSKTINSLLNNHKIFFPQLHYQLDEILSRDTIENEDKLKIGGNYVKTIVPTLYPTSVTNNFFKELEELDFPLRISHRYIMLDKEESLGIIKRVKYYQDAKKTSILQNLMKAVDKDLEVKEDEYATQMSEDAESTIVDVRSNAVAYGYHTMAIIIEDSDYDNLIKKQREILKICQSLNINVKDDTANALEVFLGAMPSNIYANLRKMPINTYSWSYLIPTSNKFNGFAKTPHRKDECLLTCVNDDNELFYFDNLVGDLGHTVVLGTSGGGKSVLLATMGMNMLKYDNSQVFIFDVGGSSRVLTLTSGGKFYDLGEETSNVTFQPLRRIDITTERLWATDWIISLIEQENASLITPENKQLISEALVSLASKGQSDRTLTNFVSFVQNQDIKLAMKPYLKGNTYGRFFDGNNDNIDSVRLLTFEMDKIMKMPKVVNLALDYLFHLIEVTRLQDGKPTMIILDECWLFLNNPKTSQKITEWLKVMRKKNASVVFATQELNDIVKSPLKDTILNQCLTKVFLPNPQAKGSGSKVYEFFGLNSKEITIIANSTMKRDYFLKRGQGTQIASAIFRLKLTPIELIYVATSSTNEQNLVKQISENTNNIFELNRAWITSHYNTGTNISEYDYQLALKLIHKIEENTKKLKSKTK